MSDVLNPYIAGNPVTGQQMFFGREDVFSFVSGALAGQHRDNAIVLYGQRRTGKTSVLYQMGARLGPRYLCILVDLNQLTLDSLRGFLWELANTIARALRRDHGVTMPRPDHAAFEDDPRATFAGEFLDQVCAAIGPDRHVLLMLDEVVRLQDQVESGKLEPGVFGYLRSVVQHQAQIDFLFALGSSLDELAKTYTELFNVALHWPISFLARPEAVALITEPVRQHYTLDTAAVDRILGVTSGHPYFTQLVCHQLFMRWQERKAPVLLVEDVEAVLDDTIELGKAVLKQVWDESTPAAKAAIAAIAVPRPDAEPRLTLEEIRAVWADLDVPLPVPELTRTLRLLVARDVLAVQDGRYAFRIDLQRRWAQQQSRLEWTKEEIAAAIPGWEQQVAEARAAVQPPASFVPHGLPALDWSDDLDATTEAAPAPTPGLPPLESPAGQAVLERIGLAETSRVLHASARERPVSDPALAWLMRTMWQSRRTIVAIPLILVAIVILTTAASMVVSTVFAPPTPTAAGRPGITPPAPAVVPTQPRPTATPIVATPTLAGAVASVTAAASPRLVGSGPGPSGAASPAAVTSPATAAFPVPTGSPVAQADSACGPPARAVLLPPDADSGFVLGAASSPNNGGPRADTVGVIVTSTGNTGADAETTYREAIRLMRDPTSEVSYHVLVGPSDVCQLVRDTDIAWGASELNRSHLVIGLSEPPAGRDFSEFQYRAAAAIVRDWTERFGVARQRVRDDQLPGIMSRGDTRAGARRARSAIDDRFNWSTFLRLASTPLPTLKTVVTNDTGEDLTDLFTREAKKQDLPPDLLVAAALLESRLNANIEYWASRESPQPAIETGDRAAIEAAMQQTGNNGPLFGLFMSGMTFGPDGAVPRTVDAMLALRDKYRDASYVTPWAAKILGQHWKNSADRLETLCRWRGGSPGCSNNAQILPLRESLQEAAGYLNRTPSP